MKLLGGEVVLVVVAKVVVKALQILATVVLIVVVLGVVVVVVVRVVGMLWNIFHIVDGLVGFGVVNTSSEGDKCIVT